MFGIDFYPTPPSVGLDIIGGEDLQGKKVLEPQGGAGHLVEILQAAGADVIACEIDVNLRKILQTKCKVIADDFLKVTSDQISHIDYIIMNPPFSTAAQHIVHAYSIAPDGCKIMSLANRETVNNPYTKSREQVAELVAQYGSVQELGQCFSTADRKTDVEVVVIRLTKPGVNYDEFNGFFMDEEPEAQANGLIQFNVVRELVNRYVASVKIFDRQIQSAVDLDEMAGTFFRTSDVAFRVTKGSELVTRNEFKKALQKSGWEWIFSQMDLNKYVTQGVKEDINKFVEKQMEVPFTMRNIYHMLNIIVQTAGQRMDKTIMEVFDDITRHHHENRHNVEGWQTNSHYLVNKRFILESNKNRKLEDMTKALCYLTGTNFDEFIGLDQLIDYRYKLKDKDGNYVPRYSERKDLKVVGHEYQLKEIQEWQAKRPGSTIEDSDLKTLWGKWFDWGFFKIKKHLKGTYHVEFVDDQVWSLFNQRVAKLKGYPLQEKKTQTKWQQQRDAKQAGKKPEPKATTPKQKPVILSTIQF